MVVPIPPSGITHGWDDLGDGTMAARLTRFLQRDIDEGRIFYKNKGTAALTDFVRFEVRIVLKSLDLFKWGIMHLREVSFQISLCSLHRLIRDDTFHLNWILA